ncbi:hypothetical protein SteCoe_23218 [Stentor coeruleus]|uniref:Uncharacterized protein n=1 Tax=Stentor coeruleus TaxID=5963 RepID=A0A1R2BKD4_9CILI|nr:hypothetical protein SteCoe_23218 [Stentor coeruleus]
MSQPNFNEDLDKPLISKSEDDTDTFVSKLDYCTCLNRLVYEYNKPHNRVDDITLTGFPDNCAYNYAECMIVLLAVLCIVPFLFIIPFIILIVFLFAIRNKYLEIRKIVKKPWKNMLVIKDVPMEFYFITFTMQSFNHKYGDAFEGKNDPFYERVKKELLERPIVTVCNPDVKKEFKFNCKIYSIIVFGSMGLLFGIIFTGMALLFIMASYY